MVLLHDVWRVLNGVACLLVGSGLLQNMRRKNVAQVMGSKRQKALDRTPYGTGIIDAIALNDPPPSLVEGCRVVGRIKAGGLDRLDEKGSGIFGSAESRTPRWRSM